MRLALAGFGFSALVIVAVWAGLGAPVPMPQSPLAAGDKLHCLSYAPFHGEQTPFDPTTQIPAAQIDADLTQLAKLTDCVRIYAADQGLEQLAGLAAKHRLRVLQGIWLSRKPASNRLQIEAGVRLARRYPDTIRALVVGNEVLLRGEMTGTALADTIRSVKARVRVPVTYADVWEFWLRNRDVASAVDFITIHILPYWEDFPVAAETAAAHVDAIRARVARAFPGKEILIGEVGWPSAGRMRDGALPSPANQARVIQDVLAVAARRNFDVNVIEAYDQPWKRALEGTVGGHWGLIGDATREMKFAWGQPVSNHPLWRWQAGGGVAFAALIFLTALLARRKEPVPVAEWLGVTVSAIAGGALIGWTVENVPLESLRIGGWTRSLALAFLALASPLAVSAAMARGTAIPRFYRALNQPVKKAREPLALAVAIILIAIMLLSVHVAHGLVFDPRYKDFPFAPLTAAIVPFFAHSLVMPRPQGASGAAERTAAAVLALSIIYIVPNEGFANWQSLWLCAALLALAFSLARVRDVPDSAEAVPRPATTDPRHKARRRGRRQTAPRQTRPVKAATD
jgi:exo-beta-1,3-glucanase (GH17 family)